MALVSVLLLLAVLLTMTHTLAEKIWQSSRQLATAASREKLFWAAQAGVEEARRRLAEGYMQSVGWQGYLVRANGSGYPAEPAWTSEVQGLAVEVFLRDNPDGDDDAQRDNDLRIFVLVRARDALRGEIIVECLCGLEPLAGGGAGATSSRGERDIDLSGLPISSFEIGR
jgi:hypothetical protein